VAFCLTEDQRGTEGDKEFTSSTAHARPSPCLCKPLSEYGGFKICPRNDAATGTLTLAEGDINGGLGIFSTGISIGTGADLVPVVVEDNNCADSIALGGLTETDG